MINRGFGADSKIVTRGFGTSIFTEGWVNIVKFSLSVKKILQLSLRR